MNKKELKEVIKKLQAIESGLPTEEAEQNETAVAEAQQAEEQSTQSEYTDPTKEKAQKVYNLAGNASCLVDLTTGKSTVTINDIEASETLLGVGVSHVFNPNESDSYYGANFKLNLYEKLETVNGLDDHFETPVYTDATGTKYTFNVLSCIKVEDKVYFLNDEGKKKITGTNGNYKYEGYDVFPDYIPVDIYDYEGEYATKHADIASGLRWIRSGTFHKGFDSDGKLVFIEEDDGKYKLFSYDGSGKIREINDGNGNYLKFTYNNLNGNLRLEKITDTRGRKVEYFYDTNGCLRRISYYGEDSYPYLIENLNYIQIYADGERVYAVDTISCYNTSFISLSYNRTNLVNSEITSILYYEKISSMSQKIISSVIFTFEDGSVKITDKNGDFIKYIYGADGSTKEYYETTNNLVTRAELYNYEPLKKHEKTVISDDFLNKYTYDEFKSSDVQSSIEEATHEYTVTEFNEFNEPKHMTTYNIRVTDNSTKKIIEEYVYNDRHVLRLTRTQETYSDGTSFMYERNRTFDENGLLTQQSYAPYHVDGYTPIYDYLDNQTYTYDDYGCVTQIKRTRYDPYTGTSISSPAFYSDYEYDTYKRLVREYDERKSGYNYYYYKDKTNLISQLCKANAAPITYTYTTDDKLQSVYAFGGTDTAHYSKNIIEYNNGEISSVSDRNNGAKIDYTYDSKRRPATINLNGVTYETYEYSDNVESDEGKYDKVKLTNANGESFTAKAFKDGKKQELYCGEDLLLVRNFNEKGLLTKIEDKLTDKDTTLTYDTCGNVLSYSEGADKETYTLNARGQVTKVVHTGGVTRTDEYIYAGNAEDYVKSVTTGAFKVNAHNDLENRYTGKSVYVNGTKIDNEYVTYLKSGDRDTHLPEKISFNNNATKYEYTYDINGNISTIKKDGNEITRYIYDGQNRLIREDNKKFNFSYLYTYDGNGNILTKKLATYTTGNVSGGENIFYTYVGNKLYNYGSHSFTYDSMGNPTKFRGNTLEWTRGRKLIKYGNNTFEYDAQGRRTKKNDITFTYDSQGRLIKQSNGLEFFYDTTGVVGLIYNGVNYIYRKDIQGNIIAILDSTGKAVVEYNYNAWGEFSTSGSNTTLGYLNPFRYRGYYYDRETSLYYLETRYYDANIGRFINMDSLDYADPTYLNGLNLYAYCNNNPVMYIDPTGRDFWQWWYSITGPFIDAANWLNEHVGKPIENFFNKTIPEAIFGKPEDHLDFVYSVNKFFDSDVPDFFTKTIPDFFVNTFWEDWMVDKVWNTFCVDWVWNGGLVPAWNWLQNTKPGQIVWNSIGLGISLVGLGISIMGLATPLSPLAKVGIVFTVSGAIHSAISLLMAIFS